MKRIPPSEKVRKRIDELLLNGLEGKEENITSTLVKLAAQRVAQELLEQEVTDFLGREHYQRAKEHKGWRNGYEPARVRTAEGAIALQVPQVREAPLPYRSRLIEFLRGNTDVLEKLVAEMYARGLSTRDIEDALTDSTGTCLISRSAVSEVTESLNEEFKAFKARDLSGLNILYLFVDGLYEALRKEERGSEAILVCWAILEDGRKVLVDLTLGNKESHTAWLSFFREMTARGLKVPLTITSDGAPGAIRAIEETWPNSLRCRCWFHKMQNLSAKLPESRRAEVIAHIRQIRDAATYEASEEAAAYVIAKYKDEFPSAMACLSDDLKASLNHLKVPVRHRISVRTTNLIERSFLEEKRRTKIIPHFFGEKAALKLVFATLTRAGRRWSRVRITELEQKQIELLRDKLSQSGEIQPEAKEVTKETIAS